MRNPRPLCSFVLLGILASSCAQTAQIPEPTVGELPPTSTVAISPPPATVTPTQEIQQAEDLDCPPLTGEAPPIQGYAGSADYSLEIADYLSSGGSLEELQIQLTNLGEPDWGKNVTVLGVDVTGDGGLDVVVESLWFPPGETVSGASYVFTCRAGRYVAGAVVDFGFTALFADSLKNQTIGLRAVEDLSGDAVPELLFSFVETPEMLPIDGLSDYVRFFKVVGWDGTDFAELLPEQFSGRPAVTVYNGDGSLSDTDGDGLKELVLRGGAPRPGYAHPFLRAKTETWGWTDTGFVLRCATLGAPTYRFQAVEDGDAAMLCQDLEKALASYQRAIFDESLRTWVGDELGLFPAPDEERSLLSAYSRYRIFLIHLANGTGDAARVVHDTLTKSFPPGSVGYPYVELTDVLLHEFTTSQDLSAACQAVIRFAEEEQLTPLADLYLYFSGMYASQEYLCPQ